MRHVSGRKRKAKVGSKISPSCTRVRRCKGTGTAGTGDLGLGLTLVSRLGLGLTHVPSSVP